MELKDKVITEQTEFKIIKDSKDEPDLKAAQKPELCRYQGIEFPNGDYMIMNEEGKLMGLPLNPEATALWRLTFTKDKYLFGYDDWVAGPAILIKHKALKRWAS